MAETPAEARLDGFKKDILKLRNEAVFLGIKTPIAYHPLYLWLNRFLKDERMRHAVNTNQKEAEIWNVFDSIVSPMQIKAKVSKLSYFGKFIANGFSEARGDLPPPHAIDWEGTDLYKVPTNDLEIEKLLVALKRKILEIRNNEQPQPLSQQAQRKAFLEVARFATFPPLVLQMNILWADLLKEEPPSYPDLPPPPKARRAPKKDEVQCFVCMQYVHKRSIDCHIATVHCSEKVKCQKCGDWLKNSDSLNSHQRNKHSKDEPRAASPVDDQTKIESINKKIKVQHSELTAILPNLVQKNDMEIYATKESIDSLHNKIDNISNVLFQFLNEYKLQFPVQPLPLQNRCLPMLESGIPSPAIILKMDEDAINPINNAQNQSSDASIDDGYYESPASPKEINVFIGQTSFRSSSFHQYCEIINGTDELHLCAHCLLPFKSNQTLVEEHHLRNTPECNYLRVSSNVLYHDDISDLRAIIIDPSKSQAQEMKAKNVAKLIGLLVSSKRQFEDMNNNLLFVVLFKAKTGELIGAFSRDKLINVYVLNCVAVLPNFQGQKFGTLMFSLAYEMAKARNKIGTVLPPLTPKAERILAKYRLFEIRKVMEKTNIDGRNLDAQGQYLSRETGIVRDDIYSALGLVSKLKNENTIEDVVSGLRHLTFNKALFNPSAFNKRKCP